MSNSKAELRVRLSADSAELTRGVDAGVAHVAKRMTAAAGATRALAAGEVQVQGALAGTAAAQDAAAAGSSRLANARAAAANLAADEIILSERQIQAAMLETRRLLSADSWNRGRWNTGEISGISVATQRMLDKQRGGGGMGGLGMMMAGTAALGALNATIRYGDAVDDASKRVGIDAEEWQRLTYAMEQSGATAEQLETSIRRMQVSITEGDGKAEATFAGLGLQLADLQAMRPADQFTAISNAVTGIADPTQRAAAAVAAFGKAGTSMLGVLDTMQELRDTAPIMAERSIKALGDAADFLSGLKRRGVQFVGWNVANVATILAAIGGLMEGVGPTELFNAEEEMAQEEKAGQARDAAAAAKRTAEEAAKAAAEKRAVEEADFRTEMEHRARLSALSGNGADRAALRARSLGLQGVEDLGGGDRTRGMEIIEAEEKAYETAEEKKRQEAEKTAREEERIAEGWAQAARNAEEQATKDAIDSARERGRAERETYEESEKAAKKAADAAKEAAREAAAAARKAFGFDLPEGFDALQARTPRESARARQQRRQDAQIAAKMARLEAGDRVSFTPSEKRRIGALQAIGGAEPGAGGNGPAAGADAAAPSALMASMDSHRIGLGRGSAAAAALEGGRISLGATARAGAAGGVGPAAAGPGDIVAELRGLRGDVNELTAEVRDGGLG